MRKFSNYLRVVLVRFSTNFKAYAKAANRVVNHP